MQIKETSIDTTKAGGSLVLFLSYLDVDIERIWNNNNNSKRYGNALYGSS